MRVVLVAETFLPAVNGVANSVVQVAGQLAAHGHEPVVVAPSGAPFATAAGVIPVEVVRATKLPMYRSLSVARPGDSLAPLLRRLRPDIVHLASPVLLGWQALQAAVALDVPSVAVFQTDLSGFLRRYRLGPAVPAMWSWLRRLHNTADLTLVPSTTVSYQLRRHGIGPLALWSRGVDVELFRPGRRDESLRRGLLSAAPSGLLVGFVGRLALEKRVDLLEPISRLPGVQLVLIGDGPRAALLRRRMPQALFLGMRTGMDLARVMASLDLVVHPGADETFCQVVQEALCSGVPVVTTASGGPLDLVRHGHNGWLWAGDDPDVLAAQVGAICEDHLGRAEVAGRARRSVVTRTWSTVTEELIGHYWSVLAARGRAFVDPVIPIDVATRRPAS